MHLCQHFVNGKQHQCHPLSIIIILPISKPLCSDGTTDQYVFLNGVIVSLCHFALRTKDMLKSCFLCNMRLHLTVQITTHRHAFYRFPSLLAVVEQHQYVFLNGVIVSLCHFALRTKDMLKSCFLCNMRLHLTVQSTTHRHAFYRFQSLLAVVEQQISMSSSMVLLSVFAILRWGQRHAQILFSLQREIVSYSPKHYTQARTHTHTQTHTHCQI